MASKKLEPLLVLTTAGSLREARRLSELLLKKKLAGCINIIPHVQSRYWWQGHLTQSREALLFIKTCRPLLIPLARLLKEHHTYELPELIACPISWGEKKYLAWLLGSMEIP